MSLKMHRLEAVIFDMDGLMLDTERLAIPSLRRAAEGMGIHLTDAILLEMNGLNENDANLLMDKRLGITVPKKEFSDAFYADYERSLASGIPLKEGLIALIDCLQEHHIRLAVATSTKIDLALKKLGSVGIRDIDLRLLLGAIKWHKASQHQTHMQKQQARLVFTLITVLRSKTRIMVQCLLILPVSTSL